MKQFKFNERQRFSIRKFSIGAASVLLGSVFFAVSSVEDVQAAERNQNVVSVNENKQTPDPLIPSNSPTTGVSTKEANTSVSAANVENKPEGDVVGSSKETQESVPVVSTISDSNERKLALSKLIEEIDGKFTNGKYASKTEESVNQLKATLEEARSVLSNATTESELTQAHSKLVTATTQLKTKPTEKKEAPAVDTTNGKATVGLKATNTEKSSDSNSIANSGSRDIRNGKALDRSNLFRTDADTTDTHANNEAGVSIINGNFEEGTVKPTGDEKIVTNDASNVVGWHVVDSKQTEIPIADVRKKMKWVSVGSVDGNHPYGVVMAGYRSLKTGANPGTDRVDTIGKIYQDINVTPGSEVLVKYRTSSFGNGAGWSTVKMTVKNPDTGEVYYSGQPDRVAGFSDGLAFINVPKNVNKIRLEFEDADNFTHSYQGYDDSFISKDGTKLYPGGVLSNVRVNTGAYVVAKENQTKYEVTSTTNNASTTSKDITVKVENKGWESTDRGVKYKVDLPQGVTATYNGKTYSGTMEIDLGSIGDRNSKGKEKTFKYTLNIPADAPSITNLVGRVEYKTWQNSQAVPYGETKTGVVPIPDQNVELKMFKTELETAVDGAANLNQNEYTPESWKKFQDEITRAREILNEEQNNVPINQRKSQSEINNQVSLLRAKQNSLTVAATTTEKNNLSAKVAELTKASTENKTPNSIDEYNKEFKKFEQDFNSIKTEVSNIIAKGNNATRDEVDAALSKVAEVRRKLDTAAGVLVDKGNKTELEKVVREESTVKGNFKYYNADKTKRDAYDSAITKGNTVINDDNATQDQVDAALRAITDAKAALNGAATDKAALQEASTTDAERTKTTDAKYYNETDPEKKKAYDDAVSAAAGVLSNDNATQAEVNAALKAITDAKAALNGAATDKAALQEASTTDAERTKTTDAKYYNETDPEKKKAYDDAVSAAAGVLSNDNATQDQVDAALRAITEAKAALNGAATDKTQLTNINDVLNDLILEDPTKGKTKATIDEYKKVKEESEKVVKEVKKVIDNKNASQVEVNKALEMLIKAKNSLENAKKSLLDAVEAREVVEMTANEKIASIKADKKLSEQEKKKAIDRVETLRKKALEEIDKSKKQTEIDKALRTFLYQMDQESLVFELPELTIKAALQASVTGVVTVELGKAISQADIISKLNLPETVTVMNIDLPDTTTLGRKFAKVTLRLPGGKETIVNVPVDVTPQKNKGVIPSYNGGNDGTSGNNAANNTDAKVDKAKLEAAIHQLDELIIKESAKLDAETAKEASDLLADAKKVFANADASQAEVDAMVKRIEDFMAKVAPVTDHATPANDQSTQTPAVAPATTQAAANASQEAAANARKAAKELPNTGTADSTVAMVAAAASALLGLGLAGRRRKEDEEA